MRPHVPRGLFLAAAIAALFAVGCGKTPELTREAASDLIARSPAFEGPWDPGIRFVESEKTVTKSYVPLLSEPGVQRRVRPVGPR